MSKYDIGFNARGQWTAFPTVVSSINPDNLQLRPQSPQGVLAILAEGAGFFPPGVATPMPFDSGSPARFITASDLLTATNFAVRPFAALDRGPGQVFVVPVNPSTPSTKELSSVTPTLLMTLTSKGWGLAMNQLLVKMETGLLTIKYPTPTSAIVETYVITGATGIQAAVTEINARSGLVSAAFTAEGTIVNAAFAAFTGGTEPSAISSDWDTALHALDGFRVNAIHVASSSTSVWAQLSAYATLKRLRGFVGSGTHSWNGTSNRAASIATLKAEAGGLNSPRMMHMGLGIDGQPAYLAAARYAALACSLDPSQPMTFKPLDATSIEARLDLPTEVGGVDGLLVAGVAVPVPDPANPNVFIHARGLSTWTTDGNLYRREQSVLAAVDGIQDQLEAGMRDFLGNEGRVGVIQRAVSLVDQILNEASRPRAAIRINGYDPKSIVATFSSDTVLRISANLIPIPPINFIDIGLNLDRTDIKVDFDINLQQAA